MFILINRFWIGIYCIIGGIIALIIGGIGIIDSFKDPYNYNAIPESELRPNIILEGDIRYNVGRYAYIENRDDYFAIPIGDKSYIGYRLKDDNLYFALLDQFDQTKKYFEDGTTVPDKIHFKGKVVAVKEEEKALLGEYFKEINGGTDSNATYVSDYIIKNYNPSAQYRMFIIGAVILVIGIVIEVIIHKNKPKEKRIYRARNTTDFGIPLK